MDFPDIEPPKKSGPGDCQRIDLTPIDPSKTIETSLSELELRAAREALAGAAHGIADTILAANAQSPPDVPSLNVPEPGANKSPAVAVAERLADTFGVGGAFYFVVAVLQEITNRLSQDRELWTQTFAGKLEDITTDAVAKQLGVGEIINAMDDLHQRRTGELFTKTHKINLSLGSIAPALLKQIPFVGGNLAQLSKDLADYLIAHIRSKKASNTP